MNCTWQEFKGEHSSQQGVRLFFRGAVNAVFADQAGESCALHVTNKLDLGVAWHGSFREESTKENVFHVGPRRELLRF